MVSNIIHALWHHRGLVPEIAKHGSTAPLSAEAAPCVFARLLSQLSTSDGRSSCPSSGSKSDSQAFFGDPESTIKAQYYRPWTYLLAIGAKKRINWVACGGGGLCAIGMACFCAVRV